MNSTDFLKCLKENRENFHWIRSNRNWKACNIFNWNDIMVTYALLRIVIWWKIYFNCVRCLRKRFKFKTNEYQKLIDSWINVSVVAAEIENKSIWTNQSVILSMILHHWAVRGKIDEAHIPYLPLAYLLVQVLSMCACDLKHSHATIHMYGIGYTYFRCRYLHRIKWFINYFPTILSFSFKYYVKSVANNTLEIRCDGS